VGESRIPTEANCFTDFPRGGHFMAWEEPELYAKDLQDFMSELCK